jgi:hypothetical protein
VEQGEKLSRVPLHSVRTPKIFMSVLGGLHDRHAVRRGIWVPTQHLLQEPRKTAENLDRVVRSQDLQDAYWLLASGPAFKHSSPTCSAVCAVALFFKFVQISLQLFV